MRSYSELRKQQDMTFEICGEQFTLGHCSATMYAKWEEDENKAELNGQGTAEIIMQMTNRVVLDLLSAEDGKRWKALQKRPDGPTIAELSDIRRWVIEVQTELPTMPPESSQAGRARTAGSSKAA